MSEPSAYTASIRVGDRFQNASGRVWKCIEVHPFGKRGFMAEDRALFWDTTTAQIRMAIEGGRIARLEAR